MKPVKFVLLACSALTALIVFALPFIDLGPIDFTLWKLRNVNPNESLVHPYIILGAMVPPIVFGAAAATNHKLPRWQSIVSVLCFGLALLIAFTVFSKTQTQFGEHGGLGAKLMMLALVVGVGGAIAGVVKPERGLA